MTLDEALRLREGDYVMHKASAVPYKPIRVTEIWVNSKRSIVMIRAAAIKSSLQWLDALGYEPPPAGKRWDDKAKEWVPDNGRKKR